MIPSEYYTGTARLDNAGNELNLLGQYNEVQKVIDMHKKYAK